MFWNVTKVNFSIQPIQQFIVSHKHWESINLLIIVLPVFSHFPIKM